MVIFIHGPIEREFSLPIRVIENPSHYRIALIGYSFRHRKGQKRTLGFLPIYCDIVVDQAFRVESKPILAFVPTGDGNTKQTSQLIAEPVFIDFEDSRVKSTRFRCWTDPTEIEEIQVVLEIRRISGD